MRVRWTLSVWLWIGACVCVLCAVLCMHHGGNVVYNHSKWGIRSAAVGAGWPRANYTIVLINLIYLICSGDGDDHDDGSAAASATIAHQRREISFQQFVFFFIYISCVCESWRRALWPFSANWEWNMMMVECCIIFRIVYLSVCTFAR